MFDDIIKDVDEVRKTNLKEDDILVLKFKRKIPEIAKKRISQRISKYLNRKVLILDEGIEVEVIKNG